jgi:hypothetical protein
MTTADAWNVAEAVLVSLGGGGAIVVMLSSWLGKVWAERLMQKDRAKFATEIERLKSDLERQHRLLQGEIEKTIFVTRVHFETEFRALAEIWRHVARTRAAMSNLRPSFDWVDLNETKQERLSRRLKEFDGAVGGLVDAVDQQSPFYPKEIYLALEKLIQNAKNEGSDVTSPFEAFEPDWYKRGKTNFIEFCGIAEEVSRLIRERIAMLSVYGTALAVTVD